MTIRRIHIHHQFPERFAESLREVLPDCELVCWTSESEFIAGLPEAEALVAFRPPRGHWARAERLRLLQMSGAGVDALLPAPDMPEQVQIANARGIHGIHMSEFALAMILAFEKRVPTWLEQQQAGEWRAHGIGVDELDRLYALGAGAACVVCSPGCASSGT